MIASTDTSRNATIITLTHLAKNAQSRSHVREEIKNYCQKNDIPMNTTNLNPTIDDLKQFTFLK